MSFDIPTQDIEFDFSSLITIIAECFKAIPAQLLTVTLITSLVLIISVFVHYIIKS